MKRAAVLGMPIEHSLSPTLHRRAYEILGIEAQYDAVEVPPGQLKEFLRNVNSTNSTEWLGFSLTMPLKEEIFEVADIVDDLAAKIYSANTLLPYLVGHEKKWRALTTDVSGFIWALSSNQVVDFNSITIIGAGATARAAAAAVDAPGRKISVINRNPNRVAAMEKSISDAEVEFLNWDNLELKTDLVINTTPIGVADKLPSNNGVLFESLYHPWPTELARKWSGKVIDGLDLLVHQAIDQIAYMTGKSINRVDFAGELRKVGLLKLQEQ